MYAKQPSNPRTKEIEQLLSDDIDVIEMKINPRMIPFFSPLTPSEGKHCMAAYIAPINHNRVDSRRVASIMSTMKGNYCRDESLDNTHLQDMGSDAAVLIGYYKESVSIL